MTNQEIGTIIKDIRTRRGLSIRALGDLSGVQFANIGKLERGEYNPSVNILNKLLAALDCELIIREKDMTHEKLLQFIENKDFAYVYGAGLMYANDPVTREHLAKVINEDGTIIQEVENILNEGCGADELLDELSNGAKIYKIYKQNQEPLFIAVY